MCFVLYNRTEEISQHTCGNAIADISCHLTIMASGMQTRAYIGRVSGDDFNQYCEQIEAAKVGEWLQSQSLVADSTRLKCVRGFGRGGKLTSPLTAI